MIVRGKCFWLNKELSLRAKFIRPKLDQNANFERFFFDNENILLFFFCKFT